VAYLLWRFLAASRAQPRVAPIAAPVAVDLGAEDVHADQQQPDEWLAMAQASLGRQDYRLAMRALYLAGLSALAGEKLISLDRSKSDLDYQRELRRRARQRPALLAAFTENRTMFERGWYGMYDVDLATIHQFETNLEQMRPRAQQ
jgi:hypothetical protein